MTLSKELDQFYTNPKVAKDCLNILTKTLTKIKGYQKKRKMFIEPSAGTGAFYNLLPTENRTGFDLEPKCDGVIEGDFLKQTLECKVPYAQRVIIGNPPFGKRSSLAIDFFNHADTMAPTIAFIIPIQFRKWSVQSKLLQGYKLVVDHDLPNNAFIFEGSPYHVNCVFQIWTKKGTEMTDLRIQTKPSTTHPDFTMNQYNNTKSAEKWFYEGFDFAVLRQGYGDYTNLKTSEKDCNRKKQWIMFSTKDNAVLTNLKSIDFSKLSKNNTTVPGFGKADVIKEYNKLFGGGL